MSDHVATEVKRRIDQAQPNHPRIFFNAKSEVEIQHRLESNPLLKQAKDFHLSVADSLLNHEPLPRKMDGRRLLLVCRVYLERILFLALAYRLTGDRRYLAKSEKEMLAAAAFSDWNPSHFLDVAEMTAALAIGYDWLYDDLKPDVRTKIKEAIIEKGLKPSLDEIRWFVRARNNWNQVCHG